MITSPCENFESLFLILKLNLNRKPMGQIKDKHHERKEKRRSDNDPLSGEIGNRTERNNKFDIDSDTIKEQQNKK